MKIPTIPSLLSLLALNTVYARSHGAKSCHHRRRPTADLFTRIDDEALAGLAQVSTDPSVFALDPNFNITNVPTTREFWFNISAVVGAPDGVSRKMFVVNGVFPGPLIEANEGDTIIVHVANQLQDGQALHWHGILQNGTGYMDGVPGFTQCPIPPGQSFTYNFTLANQFGTYWWHSHFGNTMADGLAGGLIVHSTRDPIKLEEHFDEERILYLADWQHDQSSVIIDAILSPKGYRGSVGPFLADAILVNGIGETNCSSTFLPPNTPCSAPPRAEIIVPVNKRIRFRVINMASHENFVVSIDNHHLDIVEADDTPVFGPTVTHIQIAPAQRYSFIVKTDQAVAGDSFFLRSATDLGCLAPGALPEVNLVTFRYEESETTSLKEPTSTAWPDFEVAYTNCDSLDVLYDLKPRIAEDAPVDVAQTHVLGSKFGTFSDINGQPFFGFGFNNITFKNQIYYPLLAQIQDGHPINGSLVAHATFDNFGAGDIIINNLDKLITHPFHLHGRPFQIIARGQGNITAEDVPSLQLNTTNPLRRDTIQVAGGTWAILRLITDTPGVWGLHCHIGWHLAQGKLAAIIVQPEVVKKSPKPADWLALCEGFDHGGWGPAKRDGKVLVSPRDAASLSRSL